MAANHIAEHNTRADSNFMAPNNIRDQMLVLPMCIAEKQISNCKYAHGMCFEC